MEGLRVLTITKILIYPSIIFFFFFFFFGNEKHECEKMPVLITVP